VVELDKEEKQNGNNYEILNMKIQYVLEKQKALEALNQVIEELKNIMRHLELAEKHFPMVKLKTCSCYIGFSSKRVSSFKHNCLNSFKMWKCKGLTPPSKVPKVDQ